MPSPVGYLSFTFFSSNVMTEERRNNAVDLLVNFLPYVDGQVKHTKSMMLNRMRKKKKDLIATVPCDLASSATTSSSNHSNRDSRMRYLEDVQGAVSAALRGMQEHKVHAKNDAPFMVPDVEIEGTSVHIQVVEGRKKIQAFRTSESSKDDKKAQERCLIESTPNSIRVSFLFKQQTMALSDPLEASILYQWMRFLQQQAEDYLILRRKPVDGYSISFLILQKHLEEFGKKSMERWILNFCSVLDKECSDIKIQVNAQARHVTTEYFKAF
ncbi:MAG: hypothetical protein SGILL_006903 [Bacillariaceae sp.]